jgi:hypothetical protein
MGIPTSEASYTPATTSRQTMTSIRDMWWQWINPVPIQFKSLLHGQESCVFFSGHLNLRTCQYVWVRLARQATFKSSTFRYVRASKGLKKIFTIPMNQVLQFKCLQYKISYSYRINQWLKDQQFFHKNELYVCIYLLPGTLSTLSELRNHMIFGLGTPRASHGNVTKVPYSPRVSGLVLLTNVGFSESKGSLQYLFSVLSKN